jgi:branched-chain amino acid transport system ATP-binding protein
MSGRLSSALAVARQLRDEAGPGVVGAIGVIYLHQVLDAADGAGFNVLLPDLRHEFGLSLAGVTALGTVIAVTSLLLGLPLAGAVDRFGYRIRWLVGGAAVAAAASFGVGVSAGIAWFVVARVVLGLGLKANDPVQNSLLADYTPVASRSAVYSGRAMARSAGQALGPLVFGVVGGIFGWRGAFIGAGVAALVVAVVSVRLRDPARGAQERRAMGIEGDATEADESRPSFA